MFCVIRLALSHARIVRSFANLLGKRMTVSQAKSQSSFTLDMETVELEWQGMFA